MYRSLFVLLPLVTALLAGPAVAAEPAAAQDANAPLWHQTTNDAASSAEPKPEAAQTVTPETRQDATKAATTESGPESRPEANPEAKREAAQAATPEAKQEAKQDGAPEARPDAGAETKPTPDKGKVAGKDMEFGTQEQYRACMYSEDHIKDLRKMLEEHIAQNNEAMLEVKKQAAALLEMQRKVVMSDDAQVEDFNRRTREHNKVVKAANEASDKLRLELEAFNNRSMEHNQNCASLIVKMSDRDTVMKERAPAPNQ